MQVLFSADFCFVSVFAIGNLAYVVLELVHYAGSSCAGRPMLWPMYAHLAFILVQTFFIFKGFSVSAKFKGFLRVPSFLPAQCCVALRARAD